MKNLIVLAFAIIVSAPVYAGGFEWVRPNIDNDGVLNHGYFREEPDRPYDNNNDQDEYNSDETDEDE